MSNFVFVLDNRRQPLSPCKPGVARSLLQAGKAAVFRRYPFTIILAKEVRAEPQPVELKIDPGSRTTGLALVQGERVLFGAELKHRGLQIGADLLTRRQLRRGRRQRKTRYRQSRFLNRTRPRGWLAPSLLHRVQTVLTWVRRLRQLAPVGSLHLELVRFDTQKLINPEVSGIQYQQGELVGYEIREYLLEKWVRKCAYCGAENTPLEVEHIQARSRGGSDRVSNLTLACVPCNQRKGNRDVREFLADRPEKLEHLLFQARTPLKDAAAVNSTRWALYTALQQGNLPVETGSGGRTKHNRVRLGLPKTHWLDAACVGEVDSLEVCTRQPLLIKATGHGSRQMSYPDRFGFPRRYRSRTGTHDGFRTGDIVLAQVPRGKHERVHTGRVTCRATGSFVLSTQEGRVEVSRRYCKVVQRKDGYDYGFARTTFPPHA